VKTQMWGFLCAVIFLSLICVPAHAGAWCWDICGPNTACDTQCKIEGDGVDVQWITCEQWGDCNYQYVYECSYVWVSNPSPCHVGVDDHLFTRTVYLEQQAWSVDVGPTKCPPTYTTHTTASHDCFIGTDPVACCAEALLPYDLCFALTVNDYCHR
jgi:hypothetical protein